MQDSNLIRHRDLLGSLGSSGHNFSRFGQNFGEIFRQVLSFGVGPGLPELESAVLVADVAEPLPLLEDL